VRQWLPISWVYFRRAFVSKREIPVPLVGGLREYVFDCVLQTFALHVVPGHLHGLAFCEVDLVLVEEVFEFFPYDLKAVKD
jgi:hypothetical protein